MNRIPEDTNELAALDWLSQVSYVHVHGAIIALSEAAAGCASYDDDTLHGILAETRDILLPELIDDEVLVGDFN